jgi:hypothetical protein
VHDDRINPLAPATDAIGIAFVVGVPFCEEGAAP